MKSVHKNIGYFGAMHDKLRSCYVPEIAKFVFRPLRFISTVNLIIQENVENTFK